MISHMGTATKVIIATQFYPPDTSTTAIYLGKIADALARDEHVVVVSSTPGSGSRATDTPGDPAVIEIKSWNPRKAELLQRAAAACLLAVRMFFSVFQRARSGDLVFCVTTPFTLPYAAILAAKLRGATSVLLIYDLYPEALVAAGITAPASTTATCMKFANGLIFRTCDAIITIGRDVAPLLLRYSGLRREKIHFIPNWTLIPVGYRNISQANPFRHDKQAKLIVGLSGNLGFTHSPRTVFDAARLLAPNEDIHFLLSGWGVGWGELVELQRSENLANVTLIEPVPESELVGFLSAADLWVIPYRRNTSGVSVPSRFYNLLAVGRPVIVAAEAGSEAAQLAQEENVGWVVKPEDAAQLARTIRQAALDRVGTMEKGQRAAKLAEKYDESTALAQYREIVLRTIRGT